MAIGNKFGWHSGTLTCKEAKVKGDLYVQDDIVFSDVSAGVLGITGGIDMQSTTSAIGIDMGGTFTTSAINIDGILTGGRAIRIGSKYLPGTTDDGSLAISTGSSVDAEPANNYLFGLFSKVASAEATATDELRSAWIRTRVNANCTIGTTPGWGYGVCGAEVQLKVYGADLYSWQHSALWAQLETQGTTNFKNYTYSQAVLANVGLTGATTIDDGAVVSGVTINSNTATGVTATGGFYGLFITDKSTTNKDFKSGIFINDSVTTTGITIGDCTTGLSITGTTTTAISLSGDATNGISITSGMSPTNAILINATADTGINITGDIVTGIVLTNGSSTAITAASPINVTITDPTAATNGIYSLVNASAAWSSGNVVAVRGKVVVTGTTAKVSKTAVWAGIELSTVYLETGLTCAVNAQISSSSAQCPNSIVHIQSLPLSGGNFANVPYLCFSEGINALPAGTGSNILFEVGHAPATTTPTIGTGKLFFQNTLQIAVNQTAGVRSAFYIPLSTAEASYTTDYPIVSTCATTAITVSSGLKAFDTTSTLTGSSGLNAASMTFNVATTEASATSHGSNGGLYILQDTTGVGTGSSKSVALNVVQTWSGSAAREAYWGIHQHFHNSGNPIGDIYGIRSDIDDCGNACGNRIAIDAYIDGANNATTRDVCYRAANGGPATLKGAILVEGNFASVLELTIQGGTVIPSAVSSTQGWKIPVRVMDIAGQTGTIVYIPCYAA